MPRDPELEDRARDERADAREAPKGEHHAALGGYVDAADWADRWDY